MSSVPQSPSSPTWQPPWWVEPLINTATGIAGAAYSDKKNRQASNQQYLNQKEFAQMGIRWRVEDAKAAGLHPLYALNANLPTYAPSFAMDSIGPAMAEAGQNIGRAVGAQATANERAMQALLLRKLQAEIAETDARRGYYDSETMRNNQAAVDTAPFPETNSNEQMGNLGQTLSSEDVGIVGQHINQAPTSFMGSQDDESTGANLNPLWSRFFIAPQMPIVLPGGMSGDASEALESLAESPILMWITYQENVKRYGKKFEKFVFDRYIKDTPVGTVWSPWEAFKEWARQQMEKR